MKVDLRPIILEKVASAWSSWYGHAKFKSKERQNAVRKVHEASTMLYLLEQQFPPTFDKNFNLVTEDMMSEGQKIRKRLQLIRNKLEELMNDYAGYENSGYPYKSLLKSPSTRTDEVLKMVLEGAFVE